MPHELQPNLLTCRPTSVTVKPDDIAVRLEVTTSPNTFVFRFDRRGAVELNYSVVYQGEAVNPREIGIVFTVPRTLERLSWRRKALWNFYPEGHPGRASGEALPFRNPSMWPAWKPGQAPPWPWELDSTDRGTADFRGTKYQIYRAALLDRIIKEWSFDA